MINNMIQRAKSVPGVSHFKTGGTSQAHVLPSGADASLRAIREFRRNRIASKRIPSRVA